MLPKAEIAARLKAGRWLNSTETDAAGKPVALPVIDLIQREPLASNQFSKNRIENIEQAKVEARSMELEKIADALRLPHEWFTVPDVGALVGLTRPDVDDLGPGGALRHELLTGETTPQAPGSEDAQRDRRRAQGEDA